ncbi:hypothetical protein B0A55_03638 [Friedmanniomyces simplex]|uniref:Uncharacterized protein n=1 Tax=Friedmanniomyces simplex TaxID=329884 RepID=A0A4V5NJ72_9PEZI|nr:hypothetical protein B0A55_03638 [Friedmanniomyces simplex]
MSTEEFKPREMEIMAKAWLCIEGDVKVDYVKLATMCGMTNKGSASNAWNALKKKIIARGGGGGEDGTTNGDAKGDAAGVTPAKATLRKRGAGMVEKEDGESSTKKAKGARRTKAQKAAEKAAAVAEEDGEGEGSQVKGEPGEDDIGFM